MCVNLCIEVLEAPVLLLAHHIIRTPVKKKKFEDPYSQIPDMENNDKESH